MATKTRTKATSISPPAPVRVSNAACPTCSGPIYFTPQLWLHCRRCTIAVVGVKGGDR